MKKTILFLFALIFILTISSCVGEVNNENHYIVSFNTNGGSVITDISVDIGTTIGSLNIKVPSKNEASFLGWFLEANFVTEIFDDYEIFEDITLYAKWAENQSFGITINLDNVSLIDIGAYRVNVNNDTTALPLADYIEVDETNTWKLYDNISGTNEITTKIVTLEIGDNSFYIVVSSQNDSTQIYQFIIRRLAIYKVEFAQTGDSDIPLRSVQEGDVTTMPSDPVKEGYDFNGWKINGISYNFEDVVTQDLLLTATWEPKTYQVSLNASGGFIDTEEQDVIFGSSYDLTIPMKENYNFRGWYYGSTQIPTTGTWNYTDDITLIATWRYIYEYEIINGEVEITDVISNSFINITVPDLIEGFPVTKIGSWTFNTSLKLETIIIPSSVRSIGSCAFFGLQNLENVIFNEDSELQIIEGSAFGSSSVVNINLPQGLLSIGGSAFYSAENLAQIVIPSSVTTIGSGAFFISDYSVIYAEIDSKPEGWNVNWISSLSNSFVVWGFKEIINDDVLEYALTNDGSAYVLGTYNNSQISDLVIPSSINDYVITNILPRAFWGNQNITSLFIPNSIIGIGKSAFQGASYLESVVFEEDSQLQVLEDKVFHEAVRLSYFEIPYSVTNIEYYALGFTNNLKYLFIPATVVTMAYPSHPAIPVYVEADFRPEGWSTYWGFDNRNNIHWGVTQYNLNGINYMLLKDLTAHVVGMTKDSNVRDLVIERSINEHVVTKIIRFAFVQVNATSLYIPDSIQEVSSSICSGSNITTIYVQASSIPSGWYENWNSSNITVVRDYIREE